MLRYSQKTRELRSIKGFVITLADPSGNKHKVTLRVTGRFRSIFFLFILSMFVDCRRDYDGRQKHILQFDLAFLKTLEFRNVLWCSIGTQSTKRVHHVENVGICGDRC